MMSTNEASFVKFIADLKGNARVVSDVKQVPNSTKEMMMIGNEWFTIEQGEVIKKDEISNSPLPDVVINGGILKYEHYISSYNIYEFSDYADKLSNTVTDVVSDLVFSVLEDTVISKLPYSKQILFGYKLLNGTIRIANAMPASFIPEREFSNVDFIKTFLFEKVIKRFIYFKATDPNLVSRVNPLGIGDRAGLLVQDEKRVVRADAIYVTCNPTVPIRIENAIPLCTILTENYDNIEQEDLFKKRMVSVDGSGNHIKRTVKSMDILRGIMYDKVMELIPPSVITQQIQSGEFGKNWMLGGR